MMLVRIATLAVLPLAFAAGHAHASLVNGGFESGVIAPWTTFTTAHGTIGTPTLVLFDTSGQGASQALRITVGHSPFQGFDVHEGGGVSQSFTSIAGIANFSASIATGNFPVNNASAGRFSLLLDNTEVAFHDFGDILGGVVERATLSYSGPISQGQHSLSILVTRTGTNTGFSRQQFLDNIALNVSAVPEPSTWAMLLGGVGLMAARVRRLGSATPH